MSKLILSESEKQSPLWKKIKDHLDAKLNTARLKNDGELDEIQTARLRGSIAEIKSFLALEKFELPPSGEAGDE